MVRKFVACYANIRTRDTRVIAYTAHALADEHDRIMAAGFDEILTKPTLKQSYLES